MVQCELALISAFDSELYELRNDLDIVQRINIQRLRWLGHVVCTEEDALAKRVFEVGEEDELFPLEGPNQGFVSVLPLDAILHFKAQLRYQQKEI